MKEQLEAVTEAPAEARSEGETEEAQVHLEELPTADQNSSMQASGSTAAADTADTAPQVAMGGVMAAAQPLFPTMLSLTWTLSLPRLQKFTGDKLDDDDAVDQFLREFERHATLAGWQGDVKRVQFELHLSGRALRVYEGIPAEERCSFERAVAAFRRELQPVLLGSYRHTMFHNRRQREGESVTEFAHDVQRLFEKDYSGHRLPPQLRDQILLGHFEQGLQRRWKERLRHPLASFQEALAQAKLAEAAERQLFAGPRAGTDTVVSSQPPTEVKARSTPVVDVPSGTTTTNKSGSCSSGGVRCYSCQETGHLAYQCPSKDQRSQSRRKSNVQCYYCHRYGHYLSDCPQLTQKKTTGTKPNTGVGSTAAITSQGSREKASLDEAVALETIEQRLERLRGERDRVGQELQELEQLRLQGRMVTPQDEHNDSGQVDAIHSVVSPPSPLPFSSVGVEGCLVKAMLDTGSSVTILDEDLFVDIAQKVGVDKASIETPQVCIRDYSGREIPVVACVNLRITAEGRELTEPVYVVRNAKPRCLLGLNVIQELGLVTFDKAVKFLPEGETTEGGRQSPANTNAVVRLITGVRVPGMCGLVVSGVVEDSSVISKT